MAESLAADRFYSLGIKPLINEPMHRHTSWRIGGPAEFFIEPRDIEETKKCILLANSLNLPLTVIGNGTNLLVRDSGLPGLTMKIGRGLKEIRVSGDIITAEAGAALPAVAKTAMECGLGGFAWSAGIPGTIGGAVIMNAGANGGEISELIKSVKVINPKGQIVELDKEQLGFAYRTSALQGSDLVVVEAAFQCRHADREAIKKQMQAFLEKRIAAQPQGYPNAGSVFKNPPGDSAGRLIEMAGLKGMRVGNAEVSAKHANWIVNLGGATADDVLSLIEIIRERVKEKFNVALQLEVRVLG